MFERVLHNIKKRVQEGRFVMTIHAEEEMANDGLTLDDVIHAVLGGSIKARQEDRITKGWKYRIRGPAQDGAEIEVVAKIGATGKAVIITVYKT